jgi:hypothetical protein
VQGAREQGTERLVGGGSLGVVDDEASSTEVEGYRCRPCSCRGLGSRARLHPFSADTALRLGAFFGLPAQFWMNLQNEYDLRTADVAGLAEIRPYKAA